MQNQANPLAIVLSLAFLSSSALGQSANDACSAAEPVSGFGAFPFSTIAATTDGLAAPACNFFGVSQIYNDVWFCWTAASSGFVSADVCDANYDTKLAVYADCSACPDPATVIACADDVCATNAKVSFVATAGQSYMIRVGGYAATGFGAGNVTIGSGALAEIVNPANNHLYIAYATTTFDAAEATAVSVGGHLVSIADADENAWVHSNFGNLAGLDRRIWIGFNDFAVEGQWEWTSGETETYTNWNGGEPNNSGGVEEYAEMLGSSGRWNDLNLAGAGYTHIGIAEVVQAAPTCPADIDHDGTVGGLDLTAILSNWGGSGSGDVDGDGVVSGLDLTVVLSGWGPCP